MAVLTGSSDNCGHVVKTTEQWGQTACRYQTIPRGLLCIEITPTGAMNAKVGVGNKTFIELPYLSGSGSIDLSNYYTKVEIDRRGNVEADNMQKDEHLYIEEEEEHKE